MSRYAFAIVVVVFLAVSGDADACECALSGVPFLPSAGATAPTNTRIWTSFDSDTISITDRDGVVPASRTTLRFPAGLVIVWTPSRELAPNSTVDVVVQGQDFSFLTSQGPDLEPPAPPAVEHITTMSFPGLPTCFRPGERVKSAQIDILTDGSINLADVNRTAMVNEVMVDGTVSDLRTEAPIFLSELCGSWPGGETARVRLSAFDLAGNFSTWGPERLVVMPPMGRFDACQCSKLGSGYHPSSLFCVCAAAIVVARRRRRRVR